MIPKIIHYCWFGNNPIPEKDLKCIESWRKFCPDYEIKQWDENNYDIKKNKYMYDAYKAEKWGFVPDYARLDIIYNNGGIYLDTDVELVKSLDELLENEAFMGFESVYYVAPGLGFGAEKGHSGIKQMLDAYEKLEFVRPDGSLDLTPSPIINSAQLVANGAVMNNQMQEVLGIKLYPSEYFCPLNYGTGIFNQTENTFSIHHYNMSWVDDNIKKWHSLEQKITRKAGRDKAKKIIMFVSFPDRVYHKFKKLGFKDTVRFAIKKIKKQ